MNDAQESQDWKVNVAHAIAEIPTTILDPRAVGDVASLVYTWTELARVEPSLFGVKMVKGVLYLQLLDGSDGVVEEETVAHAHRLNWSLMQVLKTLHRTGDIVSLSLAANGMWSANLDDPTVRLEDDNDAFPMGCDATTSTRALAGVALGVITVISPWMFEPEA